MSARTRRDFLKGAAATGGLLALRQDGSRASANERLDIGVVGVGGRGGANLNEVAGENVVALCDVDARVLAAAGERFPNAKRYTDFRRMFEVEKLDAAVVSTADHTHAFATMAAFRAGLDVYCEKPLTRTVSEARIVAETARRLGRVTQMGTQIHAGDNYRRVVECIRAGVIGKVREVHVFCNKAWWAAELPQGKEPVPDWLDWDLWLGPAKHRPYHSAYLPANWRRYWDFGGGTLGDMACHYVDLPFWALGLRHPERVEARGPKAHPHCAPPRLTVEYRFPARGDDPALDLFWYDGGERPAILAELGLEAWANGVLFVGDAGQLIADYSRRELLPAADFADFEPPAPTIPASIGHHREWIEACKTRGTTTCSFDYSGALTETVLLGIVAHRTGAVLEWDAKELKARGLPAADALVRPEYREGWTL